MLVVSALGRFGTFVGCFGRAGAGVFGHLRMILYVGRLTTSLTYISWGASIYPNGPKWNPKWTQMESKWTQMESKWGKNLTNWKYFKDF